jgi:uncharacterized membrane protein YhaH (DUF805 family)
MAFCSSCGTALQEGAQFCPSCGTPVSVNSRINNQSSTAAFQSAQYEMNVVNAFKRVVFENYANFNGRASRAEFWWYGLAAVMIGIGTTVIDVILGTTVINSLVNLALFIPGTAVATRRLHDTNRSGWWQLIALTIIGIIPLFIWYIQASDQTENKFGPVPSV